MLPVVEVEQLGPGVGDGVSVPGDFAVGEHDATLVAIHDLAAGGHDIYPLKEDVALSVLVHSGGPFVASVGRQSTNDTVFRSQPSAGLVDRLWPVERRRSLRPGFHQPDPKPPVQHPPMSAAHENPFD